MVAVVLKIQYNFFFFFSPYIVWECCTFVSESTKYVEPTNQSLPLIVGGLD